MRYASLILDAALLSEPSRYQGCLLDGLLCDGELALGVWHHLTQCLRHLATHILRPLLTLLDKLRAALLAVPLLPGDGRVGGHIHTDLLLIRHTRL